MARSRQEAKDTRRRANVAKRMAELMHTNLEDLLGEEGAAEIDDLNDFEAVNSAIVTETVEETARKLQESYERNKKTDREDDIAIVAEATLLYFSLRGQGFTKQICPQCNREFAYKYKIGKFNLKCSNACRRAALAEIGIDMNLYKDPEERWVGNQSTRGILPLTVPPELFEAVEARLRETGARPAESLVPEQGREES